MGNFKVKSQSSDTWYKLGFGDKTEMPTCTCYDFRHTGLLCRHFFAVFYNFPEWQWLSLPVIYREHPNISLDDELILTRSNATDDVPNLEPNLSNNTDIFETMQSLKDTVVKTEKLAQKEAQNCREILKQITVMTYNIENPTALSETSTALKLLLNNLSKHQVTDEKENIQNPVPACKTTNESTAGKSHTCPDAESQKKPKKLYLPLPLRPKKKNFSGRVGELASMMQTSYQVHVDIDNLAEDSKKRSRNSKTDKQSERDSKTGTKKKIKRNSKAKSTEKKSPCDRVTKELETETDKTRKREAIKPNEESVDDEIIITSVPCGHTPAKRLKRTIDQEELSVIKDGKMLTDTSILLKIYSMKLFLV